MKITIKSQTFLVVAIPIGTSAPFNQRNLADLLHVNVHLSSSQAASQAGAGECHTGWWLTYPYEKYESQLGLLFPIRRKNKKFQTSNQYMIAVICSWDLCINYNPIDGHIFQKNNTDILYRKIMWIEGDLKPLRSAIGVRSFMVVHLWLVAPSHLRSCDADFMAFWLHKSWR